MLLLPRARDDDGIALITAVMIMFVVVLLATAITMNISSQLTGARRNREVTTARAAADAAIDQLAYGLNQTTAGQTAANWDYYTTLYCDPANTSPCSGSWSPWVTIGKGQYRYHVDPSGDDRLVTVQGQYPAGGTTRTIQAILRRTAPQALSFAMFADRGVDIHHHGSSWVSPTVVTTQIHSNGYVKLQWSSSFHVDRVEAATYLDVGSGGGSTPGGKITGPYNWGYWISGSDTANSPRCYPPKVFPPQTISSSDSSFSTYWNVPDASHNCSTTYRYSPNSQILGDAYANSVTIESSGDTRQTSSGTNCAGVTPTTPGTNDPITGSCIPDRSGNIHGATVTLGGTSWTGASIGNSVSTHYRSGATPPCSGSLCYADCGACNQGTSDTAGHAGGSVFVHPVNWTPGHIDFPSLNYRDPNGGLYVTAQSDQGQAQNASAATTCADKHKTCHIFPTSDGVDFLTYLSHRENVTGGYGWVSPWSSANPDGQSNSCFTCVFWLDGNHHDTTDPTHVAYVIARGTYFLTQKSLSLDWSSIRLLFGTPSTAPTPVIMVGGALAVETGNLIVDSSLTVVGQHMDPFNPLAAYASNAVPGLLASGGHMTATDYDTDSGWTATSLYEGLKRNATTVRGLVYSASWSTKLNRSVPADQHWHNYDPKNSTVIIGGQAGQTLHDCNSFVFSYDPLIANLFGFQTGGGSIYVVNWRES